MRTAMVCGLTASARNDRLGFPREARFYIFSIRVPADGTETVPAEGTV